MQIGAPTKKKKRLTNLKRPTRKRTNALPNVRAERLRIAPVGVHKPTQLPRHIAIHECPHDECTQGGVLTRYKPNQAMRFQFGYILYGEEGLRFEPHPWWSFDSGAEEKLSHWECGIDAGIDPGSYELDVCSICGHQFFCAKEPKETCVFVESGVYHGDQGVFCPEGDNVGAYHWSCASLYWDLHLFDGLGGTVDART